MDNAPRYSKWKITRRPFKLGSSEQSEKSLEKQNDSKTSRDKKGITEDLRTPRKRTKRGQKSTTSSPMPAHKDQNENHDDVSISVSGDYIQPELEPSPVKFARLNEDTPPPGDVSVSFLASTPKPGRPQLSRRRPLSSVRENSDVVARSSNESTNDSSKMSDKKTQRQKSSIPKTSSEISEKKTHRQKSSIPKTSSEISHVASKIPESKVQKKQKSSVPITSFKSSHQHQDKSEAGKSMEDKMSKISQSVVERKRKSGRNTPDVSSSSKSMLKSVSRNGSRTGPQTESLARSQSGSQTKSLARSQTGTDTRPQTTLERSLTRSTSRRSVSASKEASDDDDQIPTKNKTAVSKRVQKTKHVNKSTVTSLKGKIVKKTGKRGNIQTVSDSSDDTRSPIKRNTSVSNSALNVSRNSSKTRKMSYTGGHREVTRKDNSGRKASSSANTPKDHTVMLWHTEEQKRSRRDVLDLDLVLNSVIETVESAMDVYELQDGQAAARLLKKYLMKDITHMITAAQTVTHLQTRIKQGHQSIKQKQKKLMSLQNERMELEEKCLPSKQLREKNEKMTAINDFLSNLHTVINQC